MNKLPSTIEYKPPIHLPKTDERKIWDLINIGSVGYRTFLVAHELRLFSLLADQPLTIVEICESLHIKHRAAEALLSMNVSLGLLEINDKAYTVTQLARDYLLETSPTYIGAFLDLAIANIQIYSYNSIKQAILTNTSQVYSGEKIFQAHEEQIALAQAFTKGMHGHSMAGALAWPQAIDLSKYRRLLDIGGGSGAHSIGAALRWPNLQSTILDIPIVCDIAPEYIKQYNLQNRITIEPNNMWNDPFPPAELHFYADIYHDWPLEKGRFLTQKSFESLEPGGRIIIHEMLYDNEQHLGAPAVAAYNVVMLICTEGQQYSGIELSKMLSEAGFVDIQILPTSGYWGIVTGCKPDLE
ncbi:methyltransferase (plasmid) [Nostoc sp. UHCC 0926]|uniref:methyltransferase n=1 Tax=Nostoc sp. UHCC 0926 TaxID=3025190 RepID=UPI002360F641|nr:methyltransferase [Nostoc sp. UHCC 0926]WDD30181.1 methyltransferase [Nostoc sp. UHCC 0926]